MLKIFRNLRKNHILKSNIKSYLLYAFGEVALVMIGILLALQVNNWNETRKRLNELNSILNIVKLDLVRDTTMAAGVIKYYQENEKNSLQFINQTITEDSLQNCLPCRSLITVYRPFAIQTKGLEMIRQYSNQNNIKNDSLVLTITQFYGTLSQLIDDSNEFVKEEVFKNIESFQTKPWYVDWTQGKMTPAIINYYLSEDYRKRVATHNLLGSKNHLQFVSVYRDNAKKIIALIETKTNEEK